MKSIDKLATAKEIVTTTRDGKMTVSSRKVAEVFQKEHKNVLRDIRAVVEGMPGEFSERNLALRSYLDDMNREQTEYRLTKDGFFLLAMGFTGKDSITKKAAILEAFNAGERSLNSIVKALEEFEVPEDLHDMYVYAIKNTSTGEIKLGISKNPANRLKQLQTGSSGILELVATRKAHNRFEDELEIHKKNAGFRIHSEWFKEGASLDMEPSSS